MKTLAQFTFILFLGLLVAACNGDDGGFIAKNGGDSSTTAPGNSSGSPGTPGDSTGTGNTQSILFGSGSGDSFSPGKLAVGMAKLSAGASTVVRATLIYQDGTPYTGTADVTFASNCVQLGLATIEASAKVTNGAAVTRYTNEGCGQTDTVTARVTINGQLLTASGTVQSLGLPTLSLTLPSGTLAPDANAAVTAKLANPDGTPFSGAAQVEFTSDCADQSEAKIDSPVEVENGKATTTYSPQGCVGKDKIIATLVDLPAVSDSGTVDVSDDVLFGSGTGSSFHQGKLGFGFGVTKLSAGGSTEIRATLVNYDRTPYTGSATVSFSSVCAQEGRASISESVSVVDGAAVATYTNTGCNQPDVITATTTVGSHDKQAGGTITDIAPVKLAISLDESEILTSGSTYVRASLQNKDGSPFTGDAEVNFTSTCAEAILDSQAPVENGVAVADYAPGTCIGSDQITAAFSVGDQTKSKSAKLGIAPAVEIGTTSSGTFVEGSLDIGISNLSAHGSTAVRAELMNSGDLTPYTGVATVTFTSNCSSTGHATLVSQVAAVNGVAESSYTAGDGCVGPDPITATVIFDGHAQQATGTVNIAAPNVGSIAFVSAQPSIISFKGSGLDETSTVVFQAADEFGNPAPNRTVDFSLNTDVGGITLNPTSAKTDSNGRVSTVVQAGSVKTPVRVTATVEGTTPAISSQSTGIVVSTGIPDADSFSIDAATLNPQDVPGTTDTITVRLGDRFNGPVPDGTPVTFWSEGGLIENSCTTVKSTCSVTWTNQAPKPADGRATILAFTTGEESFIDENGNGQFDGNSISTVTDLGEPFLDVNENYVYDPGVDQPYDFNGNGQWDGPDGLYEGLQCESATLCGPTNTTAISAQLVLVMSKGAARISTDPNCPGGSTANVVGLPTSSFDLYVTDQNCQIMPAGTTIVLDANGNLTITGNTTFTVPNSAAASPHTISIQNADANSTISVLVTTPHGDVTRSSITFE